MREQQVNGPSGVERWHYCPAMQFFARMINVALIDCKCVLALAPVSHGALVAMPLPGAAPDSRPTDDALLSRDWIAASESPGDARSRRYLSFPECCKQIGVDAERSRVALLAVIDVAGDYDNDGAWERLEKLQATDLPDDTEPLFDAPRVVPAVDQGSLLLGGE